MDIHGMSLRATQIVGRDIPDLHLVFAWRVAIPIGVLITE
jgi:hypothetical protein